MARLVVLSEGFTGLSHELQGDKTTIGRLEDNTFSIPEPSVSSHHCEVIQRGGDLVLHDLNSTNGTFINGEQVTDAVAWVKPGLGNFGSLAATASFAATYGVSLAPFRS